MFIIFFFDAYVCSLHKFIWCDLFYYSKIFLCNRIFQFIQIISLFSSHLISSLIIFFSTTLSISVSLNFLLSSFPFLSCPVLSSHLIFLSHLNSFPSSPLFPHSSLISDDPILEEAIVTSTLPAVEESRLISEILADFLSLRPGNSTIRHALRSLRPKR